MAKSSSIDEQYLFHIKIKTTIKRLRFKRSTTTGCWSTMTNIAEGFSRFHRKEFIRFFDISQSSAMEVKSLLYVVLDQNYLENNKVTALQNDAEEVHAIIMGLLKHVNNSNSNNNVSEPIAEYGSNQNCLDIPDEFINREDSNTKTLEHLNT